MVYISTQETKSLVTLYKHLIGDLDLAYLEDFTIESHPNIVNDIIVEDTVIKILLRRRVEEVSDIDIFR